MQATRVRPDHGGGVVAVDGFDGRLVELSTPQAPWEAITSAGPWEAATANAPWERVFGGSDGKGPWEKATSIGPWEKVWPGSDSKGAWENAVDSITKALSPFG